MVSFRYTAKVPLSMMDKLGSLGFTEQPTYAEVLDKMLDNDLSLEVYYLGGYFNFEVQNMKEEMNGRICCGGDVRALDIVIEQSLDYIIERMIQSNISQHNNE